ncbi:MAG: PAS domain S-box protein [Ignavibacteriales bacterium]|nr:MAG: PAS domain S-box protein [Ignavibacteriales bacterium]
MASNNFPKRAKLIAFSVTGFIILFLLLWGYSYYSKATNEKLLFRKHEFTAVSEFKINEFNQWIKEVKEDAYSFQQNQLLGKKLGQIISSSPKYISGTYVAPQLEELKNEFGDEITITDSNLGILYTNTTNKSFNTHLQNFISDFSTNRNETLIKELIIPSEQRIFLVLGIPVISSNNDVTGFVFCNLRVTDVITALLHKWPSPLKNVEVFLFQKSKEVNKIIRATGYIETHPAASLNNQTILENVSSNMKYIIASDNQSNEVIALLADVPGTDWQLVTRLRTDELYEMVAERILLIGFFAVVFLTAIVVIAFYLFRNYQVDTLKRLLTAQTEKEILEKNFKFIFDQANDIVLTLNSSGLIVDLNQKAVEVYGYQREELLGQEIYILRKDGKSAAAEERFKQMAASEGIVFEAAHKRKSGSEFPVEISSRPFVINGQIYYQSIVRDITDRKKNERRVRESRKKLSVLLSNLQGMAYKCTTDEKWTMLFVSKGCYHLTGYRPAELYNNNKISYGDIILPEFKTHVKEKILEAIESRTFFEITYQIKTKSGELKWVWEKGRGLYNSSGKLLYLDGFISDVTQLKKAQEKSTNLNRLYSILSQVNQAIVRTKEKNNLYDLITRLLVEYGKFKLCWIGELNEERTFVIPVNSAGEKIDYLEKVTFPVFFNKKGTSVLGESVVTGQPVVLNDIKNAGPSAVHKQAAIEHGFASVGVFPIKIFEKVHGVFALYSDEVDAFNSDEIKLFEEISMDISFAVESYIREEKRIQAENDLKFSEENFRKLYEGAPLSYQSLDGEGKILEINNTFTEIFGYEKKEVIGIEFSQLLSPEERNDFNKNFGEFKLNGKVSTELTVVKKNGERIITSINGKVSRDVNGVFRQTHCILTDVTNERLAQQKLAEQEESYRTLTNSSIDAIYVLKDRSLLMVNPAWEKMFGYTSEEAVNGSFDVMKIVAPESAGFIQSKYDNRNGSKVSFPSTYEFKGITKTGKIILIDAVVTEILWKGEKAYQGIYRDITEKKFSEAALKESEKRYRQVIENASDLIYTTDKQGNFTYANATLLNNLGVTLDEVLTHNFRELVLPEYKNKLVLHYMRQVLEVKQTTYIEFPFQTKNRGIKWFGQNATLKYDNGEYVGFHVIARDITALRAAESALKENEQKYRTLFENNPHPMWVYDVKSLKLLDVNNKAVVHYGYSKEEFLSMRIDELRPIEDVLQLSERNDKSGIVPGDNIVRHRKKDGSVINVEIVTHDLPLLKQKNSRLVMASDITEKMQAQEDLVQAKNHAEEMNRLKTSFLNNMSHEIRTPMVGILGFTSILLDEVKKPQLKEMCETILNSGKRLMDTINLILDLSRIEANKIEMKVSKLNLVDETQKIVSSLQSIAEDKKLTLEFHPLISKAEVLIDKQIYTRILNNLVGNALKYTKQGRVNVELNEIYKQHKHWVEIKIIDTGIGIPEESQKYIFEEFRQASEGLSRQFEGTGLGLTITKKLLELMHGEISLESEVGKGSTFTVKIPTQNGQVVDSKYSSEQRPANSRSAEMFERNGEKPSVMLVENDPASIDVTKFFLKNYFDVDIAQNGIEAVQMAKQKVYDAILMDINLGSGMSGLEATSEIKALPGYSDKPIIALTAFAMEGDKEEFLEGGCTHYLSKPFDKKTIIELLTKLTSEN